MKGFEESAYSRRSLGEYGTALACPWYERPEKELSMPEGPVVLLIGAGKPSLFLFLFSFFSF